MPLLDTAIQSPRLATWSQAERGKVVALGQTSVLGGRLDRHLRSSSVRATILATHRLSKFVDSFAYWGVSLVRPH